MSKFLLALDAGHGINTAGRRCMRCYDPQEHREWWLNNRIAVYLMERAAQYEGFEVLRVDDVTGAVDVSLSDRVNRANRAGADFFLSIHHNAGINGGSGGGVTAYCYISSTKGKEWRDALYDAIIAAGKLRGNRATPKSEANHKVTRETNMTAVLIEHGFMDSSTDVPIIISEAYAKAVGYAETDCIAKRAGLQRKQTAAAPEPPKPLDIGKPSPWAAEACRWAVENGLFAGDGNGEYNWQQPVTREQLACILKKSSGN